MAEKTKVKIKYAPRTWARENLHYTKLRFITLVIHRRGGKTTASLNHLHRDALRNNNHRYAYIAPTYKQAKRIAWKMLKGIASTTPNIRTNETELTIFYPNGSELILLGGDNPDAIRGIGLNGVVLDEYAQMSPLVFTEIVTKCIADTLGYVIIIGTPKGKNHFWRIYTTAKKSDRWLCVFKTIEHSLKEESGKTIENLRQALADDRELVKDGLLTQEEFDQEWNNSFEAALRGAVYGTQLTEARKAGRITTVPYDESLPVYTVWDLGMSDAMSIGFFQRPSNREIRLIDYYENTQLGLSHYAKEVKNKPYVYAKHFFPFDIGNKEMSTGKTRLDTVEKLFGKSKVDVVPKMSVDDGIDLARAMWRRLWIDSKNCELFEDLIGSYIYEEDEKRGRLKTKPLHDYTSHAADMLRYASIVEEDMRNDLDSGKGKKKDIDGPPPVKDEYTGDLDPEWDDEQPGPSTKELAKM